MTDTILIDSPTGAQSALHDLGGHGPDLVICHATGFHGMTYRPMAASLTDDFHVWAIDLRGHGAAPSPSDGSFAWPTMAEDLLACLDHLGPEPVRAVGHSMGGAVILLAETMRPGRFSAAFVYEPIVFSAAQLETVSDNPMSGPARERRSAFPSRDDAMWHYASRRPLSSMRADALRAYVEFGFVDGEDGQVHLACRPEDEAETFECARKVTLEQVRELDMPLLVGAGGSEPGATAGALAAPLVAAVPGAQLVTFDHLGHLGPFQSPDLIGTTARHFLTD